MFPGPTPPLQPKGVPPICAMPKSQPSPWRAFPDFQTSNSKYLSRAQIPTDDWVPPLPPSNQPGPETLFHEELMPEMRDEEPHLTHEQLPRLEVGGARPMRSSRSGAQEEDFRAVSQGKRPLVTTNWARLTPTSKIRSPGRGATLR